MKRTAATLTLALVVSCGSRIPDHTECVRTAAPGQPDPNHCDRDPSGLVSLDVAMAPGQNTGSPDALLPYSASDVSFTFVITAHGNDVSSPLDFNSFVTLSLQPGVVTDLQGMGGTSVFGRSVQLAHGVGTVQVTFQRAFGETRLWAQDDGYAPIDPNIHTPQCADGLDNDGDGRIDYPADYGCVAPNDDTETGGSYAVGSSPPIFFAPPRIYDLYDGGSSTPLLDSRVNITSGTLIVTRINQSGLWVTDISDRSCGGQPCYNSVFAFNFSLPAGVRPCDRLDSLQGSVAIFAGEVQLDQPSWHIAPDGFFLNQMDPPGGCQIPAPVEITAASLSNATQQLQPYQSGMVRAHGLLWPTIVGPAHPMCTMDMTSGAYNCTFTPGATNCDFNGDTQISFTDPLESACSNACTGMVGCSEWTDWSRFGQLNVDFAAGQPPGVTRLFVDPTAAFSDFNPQNPPATQPGGFIITGTLSKAGPTYIIQARCDADVVLSGTEMPANQTCVTPRTIVDQGP